MDPAMKKTNYAGAWWTNENCPGCGCRLRTDGKEKWCSSVSNCNYVKDVKDAISEPRRQAEKISRNNNKSRVTLVLSKKRDGASDMLSTMLKPKIVLDLSKRRKPW